LLHGFGAGLERPAAERTVGRVMTVASGADDRAALALNSEVMPSIGAQVRGPRCRVCVEAMASNVSGYVLPVERPADEASSRHVIARPAMPGTAPRCHS
jgi:hypothetical protein